MGPIGGISGTIGRMANPLQYPCLESPKDGEAWLATGHGVAKTQLSNFTFTFIALKKSKLLYTEWIDKALLYSTGDYIQYPVILLIQKYSFVILDIGKYSFPITEKNI